MCRKNMTRLKHNLLVLIFQFLTPTLSIILFCTCFGRDPHDIHVGIVSHDRGIFSEWYLQSLDNTTIKQVNFSSYENALNALHEGRLWAVMVFDDGFSEALDKRFRNADSSEENFNKSNIKLHLDWTNHIIASHIQKVTFEAMIDFGALCATFYGQDESATKTIIDIQNPIYGGRKQTLNEFMTPGNILVFLFFSSAASTALVFVMERKEGMLQRVVVAGVLPSEFLVSHLFMQIFIQTGQTLIMFFFTFYVFNIISNGSYWLIFLIVFLQGICGMAYGLFISSICEQENHAFILLMGSLLPNFLVSGFIWPLETMPDTIMYIGKALPNAIAIESLRFIMYRGWGFEHMEVLNGYLVTIVWILFFLITALHFFKRAKN